MYKTSLLYVAICYLTLGLLGGCAHVIGEYADRKLGTEGTDGSQGLVETALKIYQKDRIENDKDEVPKKAPTSCKDIDDNNICSVDLDCPCTVPVITVESSN